MLERIEKMELILGRELESEYDFVLEYERLIKKTYQTKVSQLKTKINNNINSPYQSDERDDLYNDGIILLLECVDKYDVNVGKVKFSTFFVNNFKFWLNNHFKTVYTGIKCNSRAMQKQRNYYKEANIALENGEFVKAKELYDMGNRVTGKFFNLSSNTDASGNPTSMETIMDNIESTHNNEYDDSHERLLYIISQKLSVNDRELIQHIFGINTPKLPIQSISESFGLDRTTIYRKKVKILNIIKQELIDSEANL